MVQNFHQEKNLNCLSFWTFCESQVSLPSLRFRYAAETTWQVRPVARLLARRWGGGGWWGVPYADHCEYPSYAHHHVQQKLHKLQVTIIVSFLKYRFLPRPVLRNPGYEPGPAKCLTELFARNLAENWGNNFWCNFWWIIEINLSRLPRHEVCLLLA